MDRRTFMQLSGLGLLVGESFACRVDKSAHGDLNTSADTKPLPEQEVEHLRLAIQRSVIDA